MATPQLAAQSPPEILSPPAARRRRTPASARFQPFAGSGGGDPPRALTRRAAAAVAGAWFLRRRDPAGAAESWFVAPEQTAAEAEAAVAGHARGLLELFPLQALREDAPLLKQDLYTIIQSKPGARRPELRKLFSALFNSVTRLDYAARSRDEASAVEHYRAIVATLETIMARI
ncbi:unnamed protein product [Spirodela intermedia]|uniref:Uncharacterized protein n=1 Tax=Spirodela intermedia TaxID=51605 RepID=A0A7I8J965_SPIIN|nr:unnamed protein product [Spirodela intermedia]CAA6666634.1 unnamed protein product [Spirodela intermedia]